MRLKRLCCCCLSHTWLFCDLMDCSPLGSSVHGTSQAGILEWVAIPFSRGSAWPRDRTCVSALQADSLSLSYLARPLRHNGCYFLHWLLWESGGFHSGVNVTLSFLISPQGHSSTNLCLHLNTIILTSGGMNYIIFSKIITYILSRHNPRFTYLEETSLLPYLVWVHLSPLP